MAKLLFLSLLVLCFVAPVEQSKAQVPTPTPLPELPGEVAQWKIGGRVDSLPFHTLYSTGPRDTWPHPRANSSGKKWPSTNNDVFANDRKTLVARDMYTGQSTRPTPRLRAATNRESFSLSREKRRKGPLLVHQPTTGQAPSAARHMRPCAPDSLKIPRRY